MKRILSVGSLNLDYVINVPKRPNVGETVSGAELDTVCGGKGGNQAIAAARSGGSVTMIGAVGSDKAGEILRETLTQAGVECRNLLTKPCATGCAFITVCDGDNSIIVVRGANGELTPDDLKDEWFEGADFVILQLEIDGDTVLSALKKAKKFGATTVLNPSPASCMRDEFLDYTDILIPNEGEATQITGIDPESENFEQNVLIALEKRVSKAIMTLGSKGSVYLDGNDLIHVPAFPAKPVDTTGAGDTFLGALVTRLAEGASLHEGIVFATAASAISVTRHGAAPSIPTREETEAFLRERT